MAPRVLHDLEILKALEIDALREAWRQTFKSSPPKSARKEFLVRILAYAAQEQTCKPLPRFCIKALRQFEGPKRSSVTPPTAGETALGPGARLVRQWGGTHHEVVVTGCGYSYRGTSFASLSEIARHITGARWSGPRLFGLRKDANAARAEKDS